MVNHAVGKLFRRSDGRFLIYLPARLCDDSNFPFKDELKPTLKGQQGSLSTKVNVSFSTDAKGPIALFVTPRK